MMPPELQHYFDTKRTTTAMPAWYSVAAMNSIFGRDIQETMLIPFAQNLLHGCSPYLKALAKYGRQGIKAVLTNYLAVHYSDGWIGEDAGGLTAYRALIFKTTKIHEFIISSGRDAFVSPGMEASEVVEEFYMLSGAMLVDVRGDADLVFKEWVEAFGAHVNLPKRDH